MADTPAPTQLYCFAHAGAGTSAFHGWSRRTGPDVEPIPVLLPGRGTRRREPRLTDRAALVAELLRQVRPEPHRPFVFYGHSLGAMVAYTLTQALFERALPLPDLLVVGACPPPDRASALSDHHALPDAGLLDGLRSMGALPGGVRPGDYWHRATLPVLRDDLRLAHALRVSARAAADTGQAPVPLLAVAGTRDPLAPPSVVDGWRSWHAGPSATRTVDGDHFFVRQDALPHLLARACRAVRRLGAAPAAMEGPATADHRGFLPESPGRALTAR
ncbi:thioesterase II family protein [Streptomyces sp. NPDC058459]|uniref:thioesterase II family protein n=1 Tax=Streptomyces sp. NPDC058459 TaxID=3346508 RepID=UPI00365D1E8B